MFLSLVMIYSFFLHEKKIIIDEVKGFVRTKFTLKRNWFDSQLTFQNLKKYSNTSLDPEDTDNIWKPWIQLENIKYYGKIQKTDQHDDNSIIPNSEFNSKQNGITSTHNAQLFQWSENALNYERQVTFRLEMWARDVVLCHKRLGWPHVYSLLYLFIQRLIQFALKSWIWQDLGQDANIFQKSQKSNLIKGHWDGCNQGLRNPPHKKGL